MNKHFSYMKQSEDKYHLYLMRQISNKIIKLKFNKMLKMIFQINMKTLKKHLEKYYQKMKF